MLENKLITDLLPLINGFNNHVTVELTYTSCAYSTSDEIHESNASANKTATKNGNVWRSRTARACIAAGQQLCYEPTNGNQPFLPHLSLISTICHLFLQNQILFSGELSTSTEAQFWILWGKKLS